jgi:hypothetical protein
MVIGVAARIYPMFLLAPEPQGRVNAVQLWGLGAGVPMTVIGLLLESSLVAVGGLAVAAAVTAHVTWVVRAVRSRKSPTLDWGLRLALAGTTFAVPATTLGVALALDIVGGPRWAMAYAVLAFGGWASLTIAGTMLKIVPFLIWYRAYGPLVGRAPVPSMAQLSWPAAEGAAFASLVTGMIALTLAVGVGDATGIRAAATLVAAGAVFFGAALARIVYHAVGSVERRAARGPQSTTLGSAVGRSSVLRRG